MLRYLVILLDDTSTSYCHYTNEKTEHNLISLENLKAGILFAMKENLMIQFVYPDYELPIKYKEAIHSIDHSKIVPISSKEQGDIIVIKGETELLETEFNQNGIYVLHLLKKELYCYHLAYILFLAINLKYINFLLLFFLQLFLY